MDLELEDDIQHITSNDPYAQAAATISAWLREFLPGPRPVLLLLPGSQSGQIAPLLATHLADRSNRGLTISLTDERYATSPMAPISYGASVMRSGLPNMLMQTEGKWEPILHGQSTSVESRTFQQLLSSHIKNEAIIIAMLTVDEFNGVAGIEPDEDIGRFHERFASDQLALSYRDSQGAERVSLTLSGMHAAERAIVFAPTSEAATTAIESEDAINDTPSTVCQELGQTIVFSPAASE